jgi:hypothetical protein
VEIGYTTEDADFMGKLGKMFGFGKGKTNKSQSDGSEEKP